jgi:tocopherol O-methyltransferase
MKWLACLDCNPYDRWRGLMKRSTEFSISAQSIESVVRYYDETRFDYRAAWYNSDNLAFHFGYHDESHVSHNDALENANQVLSEIAEIGPNDHVLDAGCGLGGSSCWLAQRLRARVTGISVVPYQIKKARHIAAKRGLTDLTRFEVANYSLTAFEDQSFDVVWALESLCHASDKSLFYKEAARLLRPGGRLVLAEYTRSDLNLSPHGEALMTCWLEGWKIPSLLSQSQHMELAAKAGFSGIIFRDATKYTRPSLKRLYLRACCVFPLALSLRALGLRSALQHSNVVASVRQYQALTRGYWFYGILAAVKDPTRPRTQPELQCTSF